MTPGQYHLVNFVVKVITKKFSNCNIQSFFHLEHHIFKEDCVFARLTGKINPQYTEKQPKASFFPPPQVPDQQHL